MRIPRIPGQAVRRGGAARRRGAGRQDGAGQPSSLLVVRDVQGQSELTLNPLFSSLSDERTGKRHFSILKSVYRSDTADGVTTRKVLFIPVSRSGP